MSDTQIQTVSHAGIMISAAGNLIKNSANEDDTELAKYLEMSLDNLVLQIEDLKKVLSDLKQSAI